MSQPETDDESRSRALEELKGKNVAHYSVLLSAYIQTKMEHDKTLVTASLGGIGIMLSVLSFAGLTAWWEIAFFIGAFAGFIITILSALRIFKHNATHLENEIRGNVKQQLSLENLDKLIQVAFWVALGCAIIIGANLAWRKYNIASKTASTERPLNESLLGVEKLRPQAQEPRSLNGIEKLRPQSPEAASKTPFPAEPQATPSAEQSSTDKLRSK